MVPQFPVNFYALLAAVVASFVFGFLWFGPLFGKVWAREMKFPANFKPDQKTMFKAMGLNLIGNLLVAYGLAHTVGVWKPSAWGIVNLDQPSYSYALFAAFITWVCFYIPLGLNSVAWERKSWKLFWINQIGQLITLLIIAHIIVYWG